MRRTLLSLGLLLALPAFAGQLRQQVLTQLSGYEDAPTAQALKALGPGVQAELVSIAKDDSIAPSRRARAVHALGWFPSEGTKKFLVSTLDGNNRMLSRKAAYALANGWGDNAMGDLRRALKSNDTQLRVAAARALGNVGSASARSALSDRLGSEKEQAVRKAIQQSLKR